MAVANFVMLCTLVVGPLLLWILTGCETMNVASVRIFLMMKMMVIRAL